MSFDLGQLRRAVETHGRVARVVVAAIAGSTPREVGAAMLVWETPDGIAQSGTIGGGALEFEATKAAMTRRGLSRHPLGPELGQCCGGAVTLFTEQFDTGALDQIAGQEVLARGPGGMPLAVHRLLDRARGQGVPPVPQLVQGWMVEPLTRPTRPLWIWGAGHVGRALVSVLAPVPDLSLTWIDTGAERFPSDVPEGVTTLPASEPERAMALAPKEASHLILTYSHGLDLALCHAALQHGFSFCGVIGSDTKWTRFRKRLRTLGHSDAEIDAICCPIGQKHLGKHPQAIAISTAAQVLTVQNRDDRAWQTPSSAFGA